MNGLVVFDNDPRIYSTLTLNKHRFIGQYGTKIKVTSSQQGHMYLTGGLLQAWTCCTSSKYHLSTCILLVFHASPWMTLPVVACSDQGLCALCCCVPGVTPDRPGVHWFLCCTTITLLAGQPTAAGALKVAIYCLVVMPLCPVFSVY